MSDLTKEEIDYPRDVFNSLILNNSPYAFYLFQWVPYQTDAKRFRLKMQHDVKTFDGREALNIWPNGNSCGPFKDEEVEFIRISRNQFGKEYEDTRTDELERQAKEIAELKLLLTAQKLEWEKAYGIGMLAEHRLTALRAVVKEMAEALSGVISAHGYGSGPVVEALAHWEELEK